MSELLQQLVGHKAVIQSRGGAADVQDMGIIEAIDSEVIRVRKEHEVVYLMKANVRSIKPFEH